MVRYILTYLTCPLLMNNLAFQIYAKKCVFLTTFPGEFRLTSLMS